MGKYEELREQIKERAIAIYHDGADNVKGFSGVGDTKALMDARLAEIMFEIASRCVVVVLVVVLWQ